MRVHVTTGVLCEKGRQIYLSVLRGMVVPILLRRERDAGRYVCVCLKL